ncbi:MAG: hypothetical protein NC300_10775 [Bacteroidales bacterium]|nr:hypothetical protein [Clostridium sp.]MCM1204614.1 hypothetical protein [Bacteroidales bacterium]
MDGRVAARILVLLLIFTGTIFFVNGINNRGVEEVSIEMEQATLPIVYVRYHDGFINTLHGYTGKVDTTYFRDTITPMDYGRTIELWANQSNSEFDTYEYELRSLYQGDLIEEGEVTELNHADGYDKIQIAFRTQLEELQEYVLVLKAMTGDEAAVRYYTRVVVENDFHADKLLEFVERFNTAIFDKEEAQEVISKSIEPNEDGNNEYLSEVNIHSSFETITFAQLKPTQLTKPVAAIKEIDDSYAIIQLKYMIAAHENKVLENYYVTEDYRVRYVGDDNVYLLDYNRTQEVLFTRDNIDTAANAFKLGITDEDNFQYVTSDKEHKVAFSQARQLWYYDYDSGTITNVYGFCQDDNYTDSRVTYDENNIKILEMDDEGNLDFAVYGYMNRGDHEGKVGISVYRFTSEKDKMQELLFIENNKPYNILKEDMETLLYLNDAGEFYYFDNDCIVKVDVNTKKSEIFIEDVLNEHLGVSEDNHLIGYPNQLLPENTDMVTVLNLDTKESREITAEAGERLETIGFVEEDLILGRIREGDIEVALDRTVTCPMSTIDIIDSSNRVVKTYGSTGVYVIEANARDGVVYLDRVRKINGVFESTTQDFITYKEEETTGRIGTVYKFTDNAYNQLYMTFPEYIYVTEKPKLMITRAAVNEEDTTVKITFDHTNKKFYAYGQGKYMTDYLSLNAAVRVAFENAGVVLDENGVIVWRKIAVKDYHTVADKIKLYTVSDIQETLAACIYMMGIYEGKNPEYSAMREDLANEVDVEDIILKYTGRQGTDITGCDFENGLYYLCKDAPVITRFADGTYVLVTSYNGEKIRYINPLEEKDIVERRSEFEEKVKDSGNVFISYVR